jgi:hypothetical protein
VDSRANLYLFPDRNAEADSYRWSTAYVNAVPDQYVCAHLYAVSNVYCGTDIDRYADTDCDSNADGNPDLYCSRYVNAVPDQYLRAHLYALSNVYQYLHADRDANGNRDGDATGNPYADGIPNTDGRLHHGAYRSLEV